MNVLRMMGRGRIVERVAMARRCVWCNPPHFLSPADAQLAEHGADITDGMCAAGKRAFLATRRIAAEERAAECRR